MSLLLALLAFLSLAYSGSYDGPDGGHARNRTLEEPHGSRLPEVTVSPEQLPLARTPEATVALEESRERVILKVTVAPELAECTGIGHRTCLIVDGEYFYETIEGFNHEPGYRYRIRIERYDAWPSQEEPPQDASRYGYRLMKSWRRRGSPDDVNASRHPYG